MQASQIGSQFDGLPFDTALTSISAGFQHSCGIKADDSTAVCWGVNDQNQTDAPTTVFESVVAGGYKSCSNNGFCNNGFSCGLKASDLTVECWGNAAEIAGVPTTAMKPSSLSAGAKMACAIDANDKAVCWGTEASATPPATSYKSVSAGYDFGCGVGTNGTIDCWGNSAANDRLEAPTGDAWVTVKSYNYHSCAMNTTGSITCWGKGNDAAGSSNSYSYDHDQVQLTASLPDKSP